MKITKELAQEIVNDTQGSPSKVEDVVSVCGYVSRKYGEELTLSQGYELSKLINDILDAST